MLLSYGTKETLILPSQKYTSAGVFSLLEPQYSCYVVVRVCIFRTFEGEQILRAQRQKTILLGRPGCPTEPRGFTLQAHAMPHVEPPRKRTIISYAALYSSSSSSSASVSSSIPSSSISCRSLNFLNLSAGPSGFSTRSAI